jgi:hypothetical protein
MGKDAQACTLTRMCMPTCAYEKSHTPAAAAAPADSMVVAGTLVALGTAAVAVGTRLSGNRRAAPNDERRHSLYTHVLAHHRRSCAPAP